MYPHRKYPYATSLTIKTTISHRKCHQILLSDFDSSFNHSIQLYCKSLIIFHSLEFPIFSSRVFVVYCCFDWRDTTKYFGEASMILVVAKKFIIIRSNFVSVKFISRFVCFKVSTSIRENVFKPRIGQSSHLFSYFRIFATFPIWFARRLFTFVQQFVFGRIIFFVAQFSPLFSSITF